MSGNTIEKKRRGFSHVAFDWKPLQCVRLVLGRSEEPWKRILAHKMKDLFLCLHTNVSNICPIIVLATKSLHGGWYLMEEIGRRKLEVVQYILVNAGGKVHLNHRQCEWKGIE